MLRSGVGAGFYPARRFLRAVPIRASSLALPLGELSPKATERVFIIYPLRPSLRSDTSPKGRGKGAHCTGRFAQFQGFPSGGSCRRSRLMRGRVLIFELHRVFEPNVAASQNVPPFSSSGAARHLPHMGKALARADFAVSRINGREGRCPSPWIFNMPASLPARSSAR